MPAPRIVLAKLKTPERMATRSAFDWGCGPFDESCIVSRAAMSEMAAEGPTDRARAAGAGGWKKLLPTSRVY